MKLKGVAEKVFLDRYSLKDKIGNPIEKTPDEMWRRIADAIAEIEKPGQRKIWAKKFYDALEDFKYVPGGRILAGWHRLFSNLLQLFCSAISKRFSSRNSPDTWGDDRDYGSRRRRGNQSFNPSATRCAG